MKKLTDEELAIQYQTIWNVLYECGGGALGPIEPIVRKIQDALNENTEANHDCNDYSAVDSRCGHTECFECGKILPQETDEEVIKAKVNVPEWDKLVAPLNNAQHPCPECGGYVTGYNKDNKCPNCGEEE